MNSDGAELSGELELKSGETSRAFVCFSLENTVSNENFEASWCNGGTMNPGELSLVAGEGESSEPGRSISIVVLDSTSDSKSSEDLSLSCAMFEEISEVVFLLGVLAADTALELGALVKDVVGYVFVLKRLFCEDRYEENTSSPSSS